MVFSLVMNIGLVVLFSCMVVWLILLNDVLILVIVFIFLSSWLCWLLSCVVLFELGFDCVSLLFILVSVML